MITIGAEKTRGKCVNMSMNYCSCIQTFKTPNLFWNATQSHKQMKVCVSNHISQGGQRFTLSLLTSGFLSAILKVEKEICSEEVSCYTGSLFPFEDLLVFPEDVNFDALVQLLDRNEVTIFMKDKRTLLASPTTKTTTTTSSQTSNQGKVQKKLTNVSFCLTHTFTL